MTALLAPWGWRDEDQTNPKLLEGGLAVIRTKRNAQRTRDMNAVGPVGLLPRVWDALCDATVSAKKQNLRGYAAAGADLSHNRTRPQANTAGAWAYIYMRHMLRVVVEGQLHAGPSAEELDNLGDRLTPHIVPPFIFSPHSVGDVLLTAFDLAVNERDVLAGGVVGYGPAVLAALLDNPKRQLPSLRSDLATFCAENAEEFAVIGRLERGEESPESPLS